MNISIIFGSTSDKHVYEPLCEKLGDIAGVRINFDICSAHREPARLRSLINDSNCNLFIAGAGIAAHLPGVIASQTLKPVIGVPVSGVLQGIDALLSILQMPKGIPVLTAGIENIESVCQFINWYQLNYQQSPILKVVTSAGAEQYEQRLREPLENIGWHFAENDSLMDNPALLEIWLVDLNNPKSHPVFRQTKSNDIAVYNRIALACPMLAKQFDGNLQSFKELTQAGALWLGVNNINNVLLALLQLWPLSLKEQKLLAEIKGGGKASAAV